MIPPQTRPLLELAMELRGNPWAPSQMRHILAGLCRVFHARIGGWLELRNVHSDGRSVVYATVEVGCDKPGDRERLWMPTLLEGVAAEFRVVQLRSASTVVPAMSAVPATSIYSLHRAGGAIHCLTIQRDEGDAPFLDSERELIEIFHGGCIPAEQPTHGKLPRRCHRPLELLLRGMSEKEVAATLTLSVHTVHEYVKRIYQHFDVSSRAELLALFVERRPFAAAG